MEITSEIARKLPTCPSCGKTKEAGLVVCWDCFKYCPNPFKEYDGDLAEWLKEKGLPSTVQGIKPLIQCNKQEADEWVKQAQLGKVMRIF